MSLCFALPPTPVCAHQHGARRLRQKLETQKRMAMLCTLNVCCSLGYPGTSTSRPKSLFSSKSLLAVNPSSVTTLALKATNVPQLKQVYMTFDLCNCMGPMACEQYILSFSVAYGGENHITVYIYTCGLKPGLRLCNRTPSCVPPAWHVCHTRMPQNGHTYAISYASMYGKCMAYPRRYVPH